MDARAQGSLPTTPDQSIVEGQTIEEQALKAQENVSSQADFSEMEPGLPQSAELSQPQPSSESKESESKAEIPQKMQSMSPHSAGQSPLDELDSAWELQEKPKTADELESELSALKVNHEQLHQAYSELSKNSSSDKKQIEDLHTQLIQSKEALTSMQAQYDAYIQEQMQKTLQRVNKGLEAQHEASKKLDELEQKYKASVEAERAATKAIVASLQSQLQHSQNALQEEKEKSQRLEHLVNLAGQQRDSDNLHISNLSAQLHQAEIALQTEKERTAELLDIVQQQEEADKLQIANLKAELHQAKSTFQADIEKANHLLSKADQQMNSDKARIIDLELQVHHNEVTLHPAKEKAEQELAQARQQIEKNQLIIQSLDFQVQHLEMTLRQEQDKVIRMLDEAHKQIADNGMQIANLEANLEQAELALKSEKEALKVEKETLKKMSHLADKSSQQIVFLQTQLQSFTEQLMHLGQFSQKITCENEKMKAELALRKDAELANRSLFEKHKEKEALLQEKINSLQNHLSIFTADRDISEEGIARHISIEKNLKAEIRTLKDQLQMITPPENKTRELKEGAPQYFEEKSHREKESKLSIDQKPEMKTTPSKEKRSYADVVKDINESDQEKFNAPYKAMGPLMNSIFNPRRPHVKVSTVKVVNNSNPAPLKPRSMG